MFCYFSTWSMVRGRERKIIFFFFSFFPHASCVYFDQATAKAFEIGIALFQVINFRLVTAFAEQSKYSYGMNELE